MPGLKTPFGLGQSIVARRLSDQGDPAARTKWQQAMVRKLPRGNLFLLAARGLAKFSRTFSARGFFPHGKKCSSSAFPQAIFGLRLPHFRHDVFRKTSFMVCLTSRAGD